MNTDIFRKLSYGMYIVSTSFNSEMSGCIVNTVTQITSSNPIIAVSINKNNYTNKMIKKSRTVAISILSQETSKEIITKFGFYSSKDTSKFENIDYEIVNNIPVVKEQCCGYIIGSIIDIVDVDTHDIFLIRVENVNLYNDKKPMTYSYYQENLKGSSPKNAPTHIENKIDSSKNVYRCIICGHIYDEEKEDIKFEDLPDDWKCPVCGVSKDKFEKIN